RFPKDCREGVDHSACVRECKCSLMGRPGGFMPHRQGAFYSKVASGFLLACLVGMGSAACGREAGHDASRDAVDSVQKMDPVVPNNTEPQTRKSGRRKDNGMQVIEMPLDRGTTLYGTVSSGGEVQVSHTPPKATSKH